MRVFRQQPAIDIGPGTHRDGRESQNISCEHGIDTERGRTADLPKDNAGLSAPGEEDLREAGRVEGGPHWKNKHGIGASVEGEIPCCDTERGRSRRVDSRPQRHRGHQHQGKELQFGRGPRAGRDRGKGIHRWRKSSRKTRPAIWGDGLLAAGRIFCPVVIGLRLSRGGRRRLTRPAKPAQFPPHERKFHAIRRSRGQR